MSRRHEHAHEGETRKRADLGTSGLALFDQQPIAWPFAIAGSQRCFCASLPYE